MVRLYRIIPLLVVMAVIAAVVYLVMSFRYSSKRAKRTLIDVFTVLCIALSVTVVIIFVLFYNKIFAVTFDENFARATGTRAGAYNLLIAVVVGVIIVLAMNLVGSLLISALVIFPALSAMRVFKSFKSVTVSSAVISVVCAFLGVMISLLAGTPAGSTIVAVDVAVFLIFCGAGALAGRLAQRR